MRSESVDGPSRSPHPSPISPCEIFRLPQSDLEIRRNLEMAESAAKPWFFLKKPESMPGT
jgi:hypothetical protein